MSANLQHCPRCGRKGITAVRGGRKEWSCPSSGHGRGHGLFRSEPFDDSAEQRKQLQITLGTTLVPSEDPHVRALKSLTVEGERQKAGLDIEDANSDGGVDRVADFVPGTGDQKADFPAIASSPAFREWIRDPENQQAFIAAADPHDLLDPSEAHDGSPSAEDLDQNAEEEKAKEATEAKRAARR